MSSTDFPFESGSKSYSTSTGGEMRELEELSEAPSEYREAGEDSESESDDREIMISGSDCTSFTATNLSENSARRDQKHAELAERA